MTATRTADARGFASSHPDSSAWRRPTAGGLSRLRATPICHSASTTWWASTCAAATIGRTGARNSSLPENAADEAYHPHFERKVRQDMAAFGFTTLGAHSNAGVFSEPFANDVVNVRMVDVCHYQTPTEDDFLDVFSDEFVAHCERRARDIVAPRQE